MKNTLILDFSIQISGFLGPTLLSLYGISIARGAWELSGHGLWHPPKGRCLDDLPVRGSQGCQASPTEWTCWASHGLNYVECRKGVWIQNPSSISYDTQAKFLEVRPAVLKQHNLSRQQYLRELFHILFHHIC